MSKPQLQSSKSRQQVSQHDLIIEYFKKNPHRDIPHPEIVDWATAEFLKRTGKVFRDPDRQIRHLHQVGLLVKVAKGVYRYDPQSAKIRNLYEFSPALKEEIFRRDHYRCVYCGRGRKEGVELHVDHIKPRDLGGLATLENGQTLCGQHNFIKKNFKQTETGKRLFIRLYELAKKEVNQSLLKFCSEILEVFEKNKINGHIEWKK